MGVYKHLSDVPQQRRLNTFADRYAGADTYERFLIKHVFAQYDSDRAKEKYRLAGRRWENHITDRDRHHALAQQADIDAWMSALLDRVSLDTAYNTYWVKLERFYTWLQRHPDHPHAYHPALMVAANHEHAATLWNHKFERGGGTP